MHRANRSNRQDTGTRTAASLALLGTLACCELCPAQETLPPISLGPRTTVRWCEQDQFVLIVTGAISATVYFDEVSVNGVAGLAVRTSAGTTAGPVTVRWENRNRQVILQLDPQTPQAKFELRAEPPCRQPAPPAID